MTEEEEKTHHAIHIYALVRVKVLVDAKSVPDDKPGTLIKAAEDKANLHTLFDRGRGGDIDHIEWAEDLSHYLIDKAGDEEYKESVYYLTDPEGGEYDVYPQPSSGRRVVIVVKGGVIQRVVSNYKDVQHLILDHDEAEALKKTAPPPFKAGEFEDTPYVPDLDKVREEFDKGYFKEGR
jgi:hypothetical protein